MTDHGILRLRDPEVTPTSSVLEQTLGGSYTAYEIFQDALPGLEIEQNWQWYTPHKAWFARSQHWWTTPRGTRKEKTLYWLHVFEGYFSIAVWFRESDRAAVLRADVSENTRQLIRSAETAGKVPTFPVVFDITTAEPLADIYALLDRKKTLEK